MCKGQIRSSGDRGDNAIVLGNEGWRGLQTRTLPTGRAPRSLPAARRAQSLEGIQRQLEGIQGKEQQMKGVPKSGLPYRLHSRFSGLKGHRHLLGIGEQAHSCLDPVGRGWGWRLSILYQLPGD